MHIGALVVLVFMRPEEKDGCGGRRRNLVVGHGTAYGDEPHGRTTTILYHIYWSSEE